MTGQWSSRSPRRLRRNSASGVHAGRLIVTMLGAAGLATAALGTGVASAVVRPAAGVAPVSVQASCGAMKPTRGFARCFALLVHGVGHTSIQAGGPQGYHPADLVAAYGLPSTGGSGQTVAIIDAYNDPNAETDLATYRSTFGLPACTTANGCFKKVDQNGGTSYPPNNKGWAEEMSLDLDMVSAICPSCHILLVEANTASNGALAKAVNEAAKLGATVISNSYGGPESAGDAALASAYNHAGVPITASSGDSGFAQGAQTPASYDTVIAVGGTTLRRSATAKRGWSERVWSGTGSGCSKFQPKPAWQVDTGCAKRTVADVAAVADPNTGVAVYDTYAGVGGWQVFGGTSVSAPLIAAVFALAGNGASIKDASGLYAAAAKASLHDIKKGQNGGCGTYLCKGVKGYDGPTGSGTPKGVGAF